MSTARAVTKPTGRTTQPTKRSGVGRQGTRRPVLRLIPGGTRQLPRAPFVTLVVTVLAVGLLGLLVLNTALRDGAIALSDLEAETAHLRDEVTQLSDEAAAREAPGSLAREATDLGMRPAEEPIFLDVRGGAGAGATGGSGE